MGDVARKRVIDGESVITTSTETAVLEKKKRRVLKFDVDEDGTKIDYPSNYLKQLIGDTSESPKKSKKKRENFEDLYVSPFTGRPWSERWRRLLADRKKLPAWDAKKNFLKTVKKNRVTILIGDTGSGKTTQCGQFLLEAKMNKDKCIAITQPRRVAAMSVAQRVSEELDVELGREVGYSIRFEDCSTPNVTVLKFLTDGMLLREAQTSVTLDRYSIIILDEAHERTLATDILFGLLKEIMKIRQDLKLLVMSATLDAGKFQDYFEGAPVVNIPGRLHPVEIFYTPKPEKDYFEAAEKTVLQIHRNEGPGDILVFLTGEDEIEQMKKSLEVSYHQKCPMSEYGELVIVPLYSSLAPQQQQKIFEPAPGPKLPGGKPGRKVVLATNLAETSITIDGIVYVVDPGFSKQKVYNPRVRVESLLVAPISKASAAQRAGRAGRTRPGKCYRLYTEKSFQTELTEQTYPEILRSNLSTVVLTLLKLGVEDLVHFDFMEPPAPETMMRALEQLNYLGALSDEGQLTPLGEMMAEFPTDPQLSKCIVDSAAHKCTSEILTITAMLSVPNIFLRPRDQQRSADDAKSRFVHLDGDHLTLLTVYQSYEENVGNEKSFCWQNYLHPRSLAAAMNVRKQLERIFLKQKLTPGVTPRTSKEYFSNIRKAILAGFFMQVAHCQKGSIYSTVKDNQLVQLHPSSVLEHSPEWVVYHEFLLTSRNFIRTVSQVSGEWLFDVAPKFYDIGTFQDSDTLRRLKIIYRNRQMQESKKD